MYFQFQCLSISILCKNLEIYEKFGYLIFFLGDAFLERALLTNYKAGLSDHDDLEERERFFGSNKKPTIKPKSIWDLLCGALEDFILRILIFASLLNITLSEAVADPGDRPTAWIEGI